MLVARRDPPFHSGAHDAAPAVVASPAPMHARFMSGLQVAGSVLAIPLGLASGYSIYHANFSPETHCQGLRANIVSMLDKSADASTLRMLVRHDVAAFEANCGAVDPDAVAAFKKLLMKGKTAAPEKAAREPAHTAKVAPAKPAPVRTRSAGADVRPVHHDGAADVNWVATVRQALQHKRTPHRETEAELPRATAPAPALASDPAAPPHPLGQLIVPVVTPGVAAAPTLPPPAAVATVSAPTVANTHPVPPASIPDTPPVPQPVEAVPVATHSGSGLTRLIEKLPLLGHVVGR